MTPRLPAAITAATADLEAWRRDLHAHPELGFEETRTASFVAERLASFGLEVHRGIGGTGVVGVLRRGSSGRRIGLRADMDALPIEEANSFAHRSRTRGRMHACGHDGHTTMLLGAARYLAQSQALDGTVHFIFQPAEEGLGGARAMLDDGLFRRFPCDAIFALHNRPGLAVGRFAMRAGEAMAGGAFFDVTISGKGSHAARPESGIDAVLVAAHVATALQGIVARNVRPLDAAVLSVTQIHAGEAYNVIPHCATLRGTARALSATVLELMGRNIERVAAGVAQAFGAFARTEFRHAFPTLVNDPVEVAFAADVCEEIVGAAAVVRDAPPSLASEDFALMLEQVPGCYFYLGNGEGPEGCEVHHPRYDFNDGALPYGAALLSRLAERKLKGQA